MAHQQSRSGRLDPVVLSAAELDRDPHDTFRRHRPVTPVIERDDGTLIALRARDVQRLIVDSRTRQVETEFVDLTGITGGPVYDFFKYTMLHSNGAEHRRRRAPLARTFAFPLVSAMRSGVRAVADRLIDRRQAEGGMNLLDDYAAQIPALVIAEILGLPEADVPRFTSWVYELSKALGSSITPETMPAIEQAAEHLMEYVGHLLDTRRQHPRDDFLTSYVRAADEQGDLAPVEILVQIVSVILAGSDTTRAAMTMQTALLLREREQWDAVCRDAALIPGAVSEGLRYEPPVGSVPRFTLEDIELDGRILPRDRLLALSTLSAMRDPELYAHPERFDIRRTDHPRWHLVFGGGAHRCLGEALARVELEEGLAALAARLPHLFLAGPPPRLEGHNGIRRITGMQVVWSRSDAKAARAAPIGKGMDNSRP